MTSDDRAILTVSCYGHFLSHFNMLVFPAVLLPLSSSFNLPMTETLSLSFLMYLLFGITALPWGLCADKFGARALLTIFHLGGGCCALLAALSIDNPARFSFFLAGIGLFSGIYHPAGLGWIAKAMKNTSRAMAYNGMFGNLGLAVAPIMAGLIFHFFGVKALYLIVSAMNFFGIVFILKTRQYNSNPRTTEVAKKKKQHTLLPFLILLAAMTLGGIVYRGTTVSLPAYFELKNIQLYEAVAGFSGGFGSANLTATLLISIIYLLGMAGQYFGGRMGERHDLRLCYLAFHAITVPAALLMAATANWPLFLFAMVHSFFLLGMQPVENTLVARLTPPKLLSSAFGMKFILTFGLGALSIKIIELVKSMWGMNAVFISFGGVSTLLCVVVLLLITQTKVIRS